VAAHRASVWISRFKQAFAAYTMEQLQRALELSAPTYALLSITMLGLVAVAQSQRCARLLVWLGTNQVDRSS
jgi:hypothetical protein